MNEEKEVIYLDQESYDRITAKIEYLKGKIQKDQANLKNVTDEDSRELYLQSISKRQEELVNLSEELKNSLLIEKNGDVDIAQMGDFLKLYFVEDDEELTVKLVGDRPVVELGSSYEQLSCKSPIGRAILGKKVGEVVFVKGIGMNIRIVEKVVLEENKPKSRVLKPNE